MSTKKQVTITVDEDGIAVDTSGFQGKGCDAIHKAFRALGETSSHRKKPEYYKSSVKAAVNVKQSR